LKREFIYNAADGLYQQELKDTCPSTYLQYTTIVRITHNLTTQFADNPKVLKFLHRVELYTIVEGEMTIKRRWTSTKL
jgi:hypothetical protein